MKLSVFSDFRALLFTVILVNIGCSVTPEKQDADQTFKLLQEIISRSHKNKIPDSTEFVFCVTEKGCMSCCEKFSECVSEYLNDPRCLFLVTAGGNGIDISPYTASQSHVVFCTEENPSDTIFFASSRVICFSGKRLDTIIRINYSEISHQLEHIRNSLISAN